MGATRGENGAGRVDRRVRRSRRAIIEAFERLIESTELDDITVSAVAREADVDRKTFYQHFGTIDGLLDAIADEAVSKILDEVEHETRDSADPRVFLRAFLDALTRDLSENLVAGERRYAHIPTELLLDHLSRPLMRQAVERGLVRGERSGDELEMLLSFGLGGLFSLYRWWFVSDRSRPLEEVTRFAGRLVEDGVAGTLERARHADGPAAHVGPEGGASGSPRPLEAG